MTMAWSFCQQSAKHMINTFLTCTMPVTLVFWVFIVASFLHRITKEFTTVGYEMTTRFFYIVCVIVSILVLSWFKVKLLLKVSK